MTDQAPSGLRPAATGSVSAPDTCRLRQRLRERGPARRPARRPQLAPDLPYGLYAEQISGSPFTAPRTTNERSWLYRIRPTVMHWGAFRKVDAGLWRTAPAPEVELPPAPLRWDPVPIPAEPLSFVEGIRTMTTAGDAGAQAGMGAHLFFATRSMQDEYFTNADGEMLVVPQEGRASLPHRVRGDRGRARRDRGDPARVKSRSSCSAVRPGATSARELRRRLHVARARADRRQLPGQPARLPHAGRGLRGSRRARHDAGEVGRDPVGRRDRPFAPSTWWPGTATTRPTSTTAEVLAGRPDPVRSRRSVDLHRADLALRDARHRQHRFRDLLRPLAGGGEHVSAALVPPQRDERVHGAGLWRLRCQDGGGFRPGGASLHNTLLPHGRTSTRSRRPRPAS